MAQRIPVDFWLTLDACCCCCCRGSAGDVFGQMFNRCSVDSVGADIREQLAEKQSQRPGQKDSDTGSCVDGTEKMEKKAKVLCTVIAIGLNVANVLSLCRRCVYRPIKK